VEELEGAHAVNGVRAVEELDFGAGGEAVINAV